MNRRNRNGMESALVLYAFLLVVTLYLWIFLF